MGSSFHVPPSVAVMGEMRLEIQAVTVNSLAAKLFDTYLGDSRNFGESLSALLSHKLAGTVLSAADLYTCIYRAYQQTPGLMDLALLDLATVVARDPATKGFHIPFLFHKGFHALQLHRVASAYWWRGEQFEAAALSSLCAERLSVDIHPAAVIGQGIFIDHGDGLVIGETTVIGDNVTLLHGVTLGGNGKQRGDRHPKIGDGVLIGANASVLGNVVVGNCAQIGAGVIVLSPVPEHHIAVGVPAKIRPISNLGDTPAIALDHSIPSEVRNYYEI